ncbi:MAG: thioesterase family protein [Anaerolineae bacterium]|nr:thioesterase family protein [Anaerolineae bacterium]
MMAALEAGLTHEASVIVDEDHLASRWGSGHARVLATPMLVAFCEGAAVEMIDHLLPEGQQTVGMLVNLRHLAATPPGMKVTVKVELVEVDRRRLRLRIEAWDEVERIGEMEHERFIIDTERFYRRVNGKAAQLTDR